MKINSGRETVLCPALQGRDPPLSLKCFPISLAVPVLGPVDDFNTKAFDSIMPPDALRALKPDFAATRVFSCAFCSISDQFPMSDENNAHHCHTLRHMYIYIYIYIFIFECAECVWWWCGVCVLWCGNV